MDKIDPLIGTTLAGYSIDGTLGRGGMGVVYKATQISLDRVVALKILPVEFSYDTEYIMRFEKEAKAAARLNHPHIVQTYDFGLSGQLHYLAMEFIDGSPLGNYLRAYGRLDEKDALRLMSQAARALDYAHKSGIIHRDIKPDNLLLSEAGDLKLCDLGLAKTTVAEDFSLTRAGIAVGTPYYISPEQVRDDGVIDNRTDIYGLGATFYHLITGQVPFDGSSSGVIMSRHMNDPLEDPRTIVPDLSYETCCLLFRMMEKNPDQRFAQAQLVSNECEKILGHSPQKTPSAAPPTKEAAKFIVQKNPKKPERPKQEMPAASLPQKTQVTNELEKSVEEKNNLSQLRFKHEVINEEKASRQEQVNLGKKKRNRIILGVCAILLIIIFATVLIIIR